MSGAVPTIGALRDRVNFQRRDMSPDAAGGHTITFVSIATLWARVRALSSRQLTRTDGRAVSISHTVTLRYRDDVAPGDRLVYRDRNLEVISASDRDGNRAWLTCLCAETSFTG